MSYTEHAPNGRSPQAIARPFPQAEASGNTVSADTTQVAEQTFSTPFPFLSQQESSSTPEIVQAKITIAKKYLDFKEANEKILWGASALIEIENTIKSETYIKSTAEDYLQSLTSGAKTLANTLSLGLIAKERPVEVKDLTLAQLTNLKYNLGIEIRASTHKLETLSRELTSDNQFDPGFQWSKNQLASDAFAKADFAYLLQGDVNQRNSSALANIHTSIEKGEIEKASKDLKNYLNPPAESNLTGLPNWLRYTSTDKNFIDTLTNLESSGNYEKIDHILNSYFAPLLGNQTNLQNELKRIADLKIPRESLEFANYHYSVSGDIFKDEIFTNLTQNHNGTINLTKKEAELSKLLWDIIVPESANLNQIENARVTNCSYAILKRLSTIVSSYQTALEENETKPQEQKDSGRQILTDKFWRLYQDTEMKVFGELSKSFEDIVVQTNNNGTLDGLYLAAAAKAQSTREATNQYRAKLSSGQLEPGETEPIEFRIFNALDQAIRNKGITLSNKTLAQVQSLENGNLTNPGFTNQDLGELEHISKPYQAMFVTLAVVPPNTQAKFYKQDTFQSGDETFNASIKGINFAFWRLNNFITNAGTGHQSINKFLRNFVNENDTQRESAQYWANQFRTRFHKFAVPVN